MRGIVYKDKDGTLTLSTVIVHFENVVAWNTREISDHESIYKYLPMTKAEIVDVEDMGNVHDEQRLALKSICCLTFSAAHADCSAYEAIRHGLEHAPEALMQVVETAN